MGSFIVLGQEKMMTWTKLGGKACADGRFVIEKLYLEL